jgi:c-di-GMP phosphodiesterase
MTKGMRSSNDDARLRDYVARQPIYTRDLAVHGYELLFRAARSLQAPVVDAEAATSATIARTFTAIGLDAIVGSRTAFVNVTRDFLLRDFALLLPPDRVALEVLEDVFVDDELLDCLRGLRAEGYRIVLDDFVFARELIPLVSLAHAVKLDVLAHTHEGLAEQVRLLAPYGVELVAEKVETYDDLERCRELGFHLFQGYFFCRPKTLANDQLSANRATKLELAARLQDPTVGLEELESVIAYDAALSYRLLRYINSAYFSLAREVRSVQDAMILLGVEKIRSWASLMLLADVADGPRELLVTAMVRARMCERLAVAAGAVPQVAFTAGLFSVLDALVDRPMADALASLPISPGLLDALLRGEGPEGRVLTHVLAYERGSFEAATNGSGAQELGDAYLDAIAWSQAVAGGLD